MSFSLPNPSISFTPNIMGLSSKKGKAPAGAIAGGVIGGLALILAAIAIFYFLRRKSEKAALEKKLADSESRPAPVTLPGGTSGPVPRVVPVVSTGEMGSLGVERNASLLSRLLPLRGSQPSQSTSSGPSSAPQSGISPFPASATQTTTSALDEKRALRNLETQAAAIQGPVSPESSSISPNESRSAGLSYTSPSEQTSSALAPIRKERLPASSQGGSSQHQHVQSQESLTTDVSGSRAAASATSQEDLRAEVLELRRQMEEIRLQALSQPRTGGDPNEPPPSYS